MEDGRVYTGEIDIFEVLGHESNIIHSMDVFSANADFNVALDKFRCVFHRGKGNHLKV